MRFALGAALSRGLGDQETRRRRQRAFAIEGRIIRMHKNGEGAEPPRLGEVRPAATPEEAAHRPDVLLVGQRRLKRFLSVVTTHVESYFFVGIAWL